MRAASLFAATCGVLLSASRAAGQTNAPGTTGQPSVDPVRVMVGRLNLDATNRPSWPGALRGSTPGTARNRAAVDWIEAQLKSYGYTNTERVTYEYTGRRIQNDSTRRADSLARVAKGLPPLPARGGGNGAAGRGAAGGRGGIRDSAGLRIDRNGNIVKGNTPSRAST